MPNRSASVLNLEVVNGSPDALMQYFRAAAEKAEQDQILEAKYQLSRVIKPDNAENLDALCRQESLVHPGWSLQSVRPLDDGNHAVQFLASNERVSIENMRDTLEELAPFMKCRPFEVLGRQVYSNAPSEWVVWFNPIHDTLETCPGFVYRNENGHITDPRHPWCRVQWEEEDDIPEEVDPFFIPPSDVRKLKRLRHETLPAEWNPTARSISHYLR